MQKIILLIVVTNDKIVSDLGFNHVVLHSRPICKDDLIMNNLTKQTTSFSLLGNVMSSTMLTKYVINVALWCLVVLSLVENYHYHQEWQVQISHVSMLRNQKVVHQLKKKKNALQNFKTYLHEELHEAGLSDIV